MRKNKMIKTSRLLLLAMALGGFTNPTLAAPIEHIGDRYIMHVSEMDLTGEESLLDVLMMCPEVLTMDGNTIIGGDPSPISTASSSSASTTRNMVSTTLPCSIISRRGR